jgi:hypothetical protein
MPKPLDPLLAQELSILEQDVIELHQMLGTLEDFYVLQRDDIKVLNRHAKRLILSSLPALVESAVIHIGRLMDPVETHGGKDQNLTLERLMLTCRELGHMEVAGNLSIQLGQLRTATHDTLKKLRHKRYAHRDWVHALNQGLLPKIHLHDLREVSRLMGAFINTINVALTECSFCFDSDNQGSLAQLAQTLKDYDKRVFASATLRSK